MRKLIIVAMMIALSPLNVKASQSDCDEVSPGSIWNNEAQSCEMKISNNKRVEQEQVGPNVKVGHVAISDSQNFVSVNFIASHRGVVKVVAYSDNKVIGSVDWFVDNKINKAIVNIQGSKLGKNIQIDAYYK